MNWAGFKAVKPWWAWALGSISILLGLWLMERTLASWFNSGPALRHAVVPLLFLLLNFVSGALWTAGGIGLLSLQRWGRICLLSAVSIEFARALLSAISLLTLIFILRGRQPWLVPLSIAILAFWIGSLFWLGFFLRSDRVRRLTIQKAEPQA